MADDKIQEGDREAGERIPTDDNEVIDMGDMTVSPIIGDDGEQESEKKPKKRAKKKVEESELIAVEIGGVSHEVTQEVYNSIVQERTFLQSEPAPIVEEKDAVDLESLIFTDPTAAMKLMKDEIQTELRGEYSQDQARNKFWSDFYTTNPHLQEEDAIVKMVMQREWNNIASLPTTPGIKKLSTLVEEEILRIVNKQGGKKGAGERITTLEGGGYTTDQADADALEDKGDKEEESAEVHSIGDAIRERSRLRRLARGSLSTLTA